ncbi:MAG: TorF family putative porin [Gammaproteobacteria bacterium]|nr:TorF family putative porin [Gammaproteobacteria bacterium]
MRNKAKRIRAILLGGLLTVLGGHAPGVLAQTPLDAENFSGTVTMTTDYVYRGISFSSQNPAIQGSADWAYGSWFAGIWGTSVDEAGVDLTSEFDFYFGFASSTAGFDWYIQPIYYHYPNADEDAYGDPDMFEIWLHASQVVAEAPGAPTVDLLYGYTPDYFYESGSGHYIRGGVAFDLGGGIGVDFGWGYQTVKGEHDTFWPNVNDPEYAHWDVGVTGAIADFDLDLRYHDTNQETGDAFIAGGFSTEANTESRIVFTISRSF